MGSVMQTVKDKNMTTRERIQKAIREMSEAGCKMTISGVAEEAGVSNATIHNRYPDLAAKIREMVNETTENDPKRIRRKKKRKGKTPKQQIQVLRDELTGIKQKLAKVHSVNFSIDQENQSLKAENEALKRQLAETLKGKKNW